MGKPKCIAALWLLGILLFHAAGCGGQNNVQIENEVRQLEEPCLKITCVERQVKKNITVDGINYGTEMFPLKSLKGGRLFQEQFVMGMQVLPSQTGMVGGQLDIALFNKEEREDGTTAFDCGIWYDSEFFYVEGIVWDGKEERVICRGPNWTVSLTSHYDSIVGKSITRIGQ